MTIEQKRNNLISRYNTAAMKRDFEKRDELFRKIQLAVDDCTLAVKFVTVKDKDGWFLMAVLMNE